MRAQFKTTPEIIKSEVIKETSDHPLKRPRSSTILENDRRR